MRRVCSFFVKREICMTKKNEAVLPKIPGAVYNGVYKYKFGLFLSIFFLIVIPLYMFPEIKFDIESIMSGNIDFFKKGGVILPDLNKNSVVYIILIVLIAYCLFFEKRVLLVDVTETSVSAKIVNNKVEIIDDPLENYFLQVVLIYPNISHNTISGTYKYGVSLIRRDPIKQLPLVLVDAIYCPKHLKEWVESFQSQIAKPLPIKFSSPDVESDYNTGVYQSLKKLGNKKHL